LRGLVGGLRADKSSKGMIPQCFARRSVLNGNHVDTGLRTQSGAAMSNRHFCELIVGTFHH